jgi:glycosyltransferase involved in cell wall biosynthesis
LSKNKQQKYTFHVVNLPHTQTTSEYTHCAYTQKVRKFCNMMTDLGHEVILYASEENEARVSELVTVISKEEQKQFFGEYDHRVKQFNITWGVSDPHWLHMNSNAIEEIGKRIKPKDFICLIGGVCQQMIANAFPDHMSVEYGIGYTGVFSRYRVFESYAHMHYVHGDNHDDNGNFYDTVIPNYYDKEEFPFSERNDEEPYYLFIGRLIDRKGWRIAQEVCANLGKKFVVAGQGDFDGYGEHVGTVGVEERGRLMSNASAVFVPTTYLEPFGGVHAEALLAGTPVITTNFGVFTETVANGENGYRCDDFNDFIEATKAVETFSDDKRRKIQKNAQARFSTDVVGKQYEKYFDRLYNLWGNGWYTLK